MKSGYYRISSTFGKYLARVLEHSGESPDYPEMLQEIKRRWDAEVLEILGVSREEFGRKTGEYFERNLEELSQRLSTGDQYLVSAKELERLLRSYKQLKHLLDSEEAVSGGLPDSEEANPEDSLEQLLDDEGDARA